MITQVFLEFYEAVLEQRKLLQSVYICVIHRFAFPTTLSPLMAPNNTNNDYLPSSAHIFGIGIVIDVSSIPDKPRTVLISAAFYTGEGPVLGLFRYYNGIPGIAFEPHEKYFIHSTVCFFHTAYLLCSLVTGYQVARFEYGVVVKSQDPPPEVDDEFDLMGDIFHVSVFLYFLLHFHFSQGGCQIIPLPGASARYLPTIVVTGKPSKIGKETFEIDVGQWISFSKGKALFPFNGTVPEGGRWSGNNCPFPNSNTPKYVSVIGFLTEVLLLDDGGKKSSAKTLLPADGDGQSSIETVLPRGSGRRSTAQGALGEGSSKLPAVEADPPKGSSRRFVVEIEAINFLGAAPQTFPKST